NQVLAHRQALEDAAALRNERDALRGDLLRRQVSHALAEYRDIAGARMQQPDGDVEAGGFAGAVAAEQAEHARFAKLERYVLEDMTVPVKRVDPLQRERASGQDRPLWCVGRRQPQYGCLRRSPHRNATA